MVMLPPAITSMKNYGTDNAERIYSDADHETWRFLFERQNELLAGRAADEFLDGLGALGVAAHGIPNINKLNDVLLKATRWQIVLVEGLVPDLVFFDHLAHRRFPVTWWIRKPEQIDYLQEPDLFHDIYGHVPLLVNPVFADYMQQYGLGGVKAASLDALQYLARLYWYTVEFGLIRSPKGLRIYGSGILSSKSESIYCLDSPRPRRIPFDLLRIMQTEYKIDAVQACYFVIGDFMQLFEATRPDFTPYYRELKTRPTLKPDAALR